MAITEVYVDPSIAADSGSGTIGDPYGDLEYAIEQTTFDTTNGTRVNIKAGTAEVLAAALDAAETDTGTSVAWVPSGTAFVVYQGYTSTAGDGGRAEIDCTTSGTLIGARNYHKFIDIDVTNTAGEVLRGTRDVHILRCSIEGNSSGKSVYLTSVNNTIHDSYFYGTSGSHICIDATAYITNNYVSYDGTSAAIWNAKYVANNIVVLSAAGGNGIYAPDDGVIINNSIYNSGGNGTGQGIYGYSAGIINNNLIEGFNGTGGKGIDVQTGTKPVTSWRGNAFYNCATNINGTPIYLDASDAATNETLTASPFTNAPTDFTPVNTGSVKEGSEPGTIGGGLV